MADKIYIDVFGKCELPVGECDTVYLCLDHTWRGKVVSGVPLIPAEIIAKCPFEHQYIKSDGCAVKKTSKNVCKYHVEVSVEHFLIDQSNGIPFLPCSDDITGIVPFKCAFDHLLYKIDNLEIPDGPGDSSSLTVDYDGGTFTFTPVAGDPTIVNICNLIASCLEEDQVPNSSQNTDSINVSATGILNRQISASLNLAPSTIGNPNMAEIVPGEGLRVPPTPAPTLVAGNGIDIAGNTISARRPTTWAALNYPCGSTSGAPVYADSGGNLRTVPHHHSIARDGTRAGTVPNGTNISTVGNVLIDSTVTPFAIDNNTCRTIEVLYAVTFVVQVVVYPNGTWAFDGQISTNGGNSYTTLASTQWGSFPGIMGMPWHMPAFGRWTIAPGSSLVVSFRNRIRTIASSDPGSYYVNGIIGYTYLGSTTEYSIA